MPVDPTIPMSFNAQMPVGPNWNAALAGAQRAWDVDAAHTQAQDKNAIRSIFADPNAMDASGNPTADATRRVMAVSPQMGMQLRNNQLVQQQHQLQTDLLKSKTFQQQYGMAADVMGEGVVAYEEALRSGMPEPQARAKGQEAMDSGFTRLRQSGLFSEAQVGMFPKQFDPTQAREFSMGHKDYEAWREKQVADERQAARDAEIARHNRETEKRSEGGTWQILSDPNAKDEQGNPVQYRYHTGTGEATTLDLKPYTPKGAAKLSAGGAMTPATLTKEQKESLGAQASTGQPLTQIIPGYRQDSTQLRQIARDEAIKKIQTETGMSAADAAVELANRSVDFGAEKRSVGQLTTMLGATETAVKQLDFNVGKVTEEMRKLPSSDISPVINAIIRGEQKWTGNPAYAGLFFFMNAAATESARIMSGGQASVAQLNEGARQEAQKWANVGMTPSSWREVSKSMLEEGQNRIQNYQEAIKGRRVGGQPTTGATAQPPPAQRTEGGGAGAAKSTPAVPTVRTQADYDAIPNGAQYRHPDGSIRTKGKSAKPAAPTQTEPAGREG
jgi:hypothetical protein